MRLFAAVNRKITRNIALSDRPLETAEGPDLAHMIEEPRQLVGRRRRKRHADDREELCQIIAGQGEVQLCRFEMQWVEQAAGNAEFCVPQHPAGFDRVRIIDPAQTEQRAAVRLKAARQALEQAFPGHFQTGFPGF